MFGEGLRFTTSPLTELCSLDCQGDAWMKDWKWFGRTRSWPNRGTVLAFPRRGWVKWREISGSPTTRLRCEPRTSAIRARSVTTTTAIPDRSVLIRCNLGSYVKVFETRQLVCRQLTPESLGDCNSECEYRLLFYWIWRRIVWCMAGFLSVHLRENLRWKKS
jgi:hypothetical protein